jgi:hypothetical protein
VAAVLRASLAPTSPRGFGCPRSCWTSRRSRRRGHPRLSSTELPFCSARDVDLEYTPPAEDGRLTRFSNRGVGVVRHDVSVNEFRLIRYRAEYKNGSVVDGVEPVIDGRELSDLLEDRPDDGSSWSWMPYEVVAPPSRHWLGHPERGFGDARGLTAVLDGGCRVWECCGPGARIKFQRNRVIWDIPGPGPFEFDRHQYEAEISRLADMPQELFRPTDLHPLDDGG